jgi:hypothetical protein
MTIYSTPSHARMPGSCGGDRPSIMTDAGWRAYNAVMDQLATYLPNRILRSEMSAVEPKGTETASARHPTHVDIEVHPWSTPASGEEQAC